PMLVQSGAAGLVWWRAQLSDLRDSKPAQFLRRAFRSQVLQAVLREQELAHLFASLRCAGVEPILVKGWAIARLYPEKGLRPQGDIDLIVGPHQLSDAYAVLRTPDCEGYQVDLDHREFHRLDARALDGLYARSRLIDDGNVPVRILGAEDHLSFLCRHSLRHSACRPLWLCDIAAELEARPPDFDWDLILRNRQQRDYVETAVSLAHSLIGARLDDTPFASKSGKLPRWLIPAVLRQWENSDPMAHAPFNHLKPMGSYVRNPSGFLKGLIARWPDPIQATVTIGAPFNQVPRLPFQVGECMLRAMKALPIASEAARPAED
ncbi:MAG TPA: nucleotidyltransferase family protein, partial [Blastocatellia bacterium]|nr:nucleotidyltransferase family protein [Blastocatellia bacterium]